jgi:hypothetical protein
LADPIQRLTTRDRELFSDWQAVFPHDRHEGLEHRPAVVDNLQSQIHIGVVAIGWHLSAGWTAKLR